ncbi:hypothetical protein HDU96_004203 [Phlyctochytrium bullatum]|nr:hypothetical protein HDU96_004203 [Phlyctochytrium bullatum]
MHPIRILIALAALAATAVHARPVDLAADSLDAALANRDRPFVPPLKRRQELNERRNVDDAPKAAGGFIPPLDRREPANDEAEVADREGMRPPLKRRASANDEAEVADREGMRPPLKRREPANDEAVVANRERTTIPPLKRRGTCDSVEELNRRQDEGAGKVNAAPQAADCVVPPLKRRAEGDAEVAFRENYPIPPLK